MKNYALSSGEAAGILKVTTQAVRNMARAGQLSYEVRYAGISNRPRWMFDREEVEALARERAGNA